MTAAAGVFAVVVGVVCVRACVRAWLPGRDALGRCAWAEAPRGLAHHERAETEWMCSRCAAAVPSDLGAVHRQVFMCVCVCECVGERARESLKA